MTRHLVPGLAHQDLEERLHEVEVGGDDVLDVGAQHLDGHDAPVEEPCPVHDGDGGGPDGLGVELGERVAERQAEVLLHPLAHVGERDGGPVSRQARNSSATSSPNIPGDDAMIWPNFMKVPPRSWKLLRSGRASCAAGSGAVADGAQLAQRRGREVDAHDLGDGAAAAHQLAAGGLGQAARVDPWDVLGQRARRRRAPAPAGALSARCVRRASVTGSG